MHAWMSTDQFDSRSSDNRHTHDALTPSFVGSLRSCCRGSCCFDKLFAMQNAQNEPHVHVPTSIATVLGRDLVDKCAKTACRCVLGRHLVHKCVERQGRHASV